MRVSRSTNSTPSSCGTAASPKIRTAGNSTPSVGGVSCTVNGMMGTAGSPVEPSSPEITAINIAVHTFPGKKDESDASFLRQGPERVLYPVHN
jgi:hypothetical protein